MYIQSLEYPHLELTEGDMTTDCDWAAAFTRAGGLAAREGG